MKHTYEVLYDRARRAAPILLPLYILGVLYFTMLWKSGGFTGTYVMKLNLIPLFWLWEPVFTGKNFYLSQVVLNILLFIPMGMVLPIQSKRCIGFHAVLSLCGAASLLIELAQPLFGRCTDIDDLCLNMLGGFLGYLLLRFVCPRLFCACLLQYKFTLPEVCRTFLHRNPTLKRQVPSTCL